MHPDLALGKQFPNLTLSDHRQQLMTLSENARGFPLVLSFYRGYWWPKCALQLRRLVDLQEELQVNYCKLAVVSVDPPEVSAAFRTGLAATYTFLSDYERKAIRQLDIVEVTPPDFKYGLVALPFTFSLAPDLTIHTIYDGWWFVGRPTIEELRQDLRALMRACRQDYHYTGPSLSDIERT